MAVTGTSTYLPATDDLVLEAWERLNLSPTILTGDVARSARRSLQLMLVDWSNRGLQLWQIDRQTMTCIVGQAAYAAPAGTVDVLELWVSLASGTTFNDITLGDVGRDQYAALPNKTMAGRPTQYWSERTRDAVVLHLWPVPDLAYPLSMNRFRLPLDVGGPANSIDMPILWAEAAAAGLAASLARKYAPALYELRAREADAAYAAANAESRERVPLTIAPDLRGYW